MVQGELTFDKCDLGFESVLDQRFPLCGGGRVGGCRAGEF
jgi:hypothetical protein